MTLALLSSCGASKLSIKGVSYQSIRNEKTDMASKNALPDSVDILLEPALLPDGTLLVSITNLSSKVMIIDKTQSFFVAPSGQSIMYYDPTVNVHTSTTSNTGTKGASVNLGAVGGALGIGGVAGGILRGINVGGANSSTTAYTNTSYDVDSPTATIAPRSRITMSREFNVDGVGSNTLKLLFDGSKGKDLFVEYNQDNSYCRFGVCLSYSIDGGKTYKQIDSRYYASSVIISHTKEKGKVNDALRQVYINKPNSLNEPWYLLYFIGNNMGKNNSYKSDNLYDYD